MKPVSLAVVMVLCAATARAADIIDEVFNAPGKMFVVNDVIMEDDSGQIKELISSMNVGNSQVTKVTRRLTCQKDPIRATKCTFGKEGTLREELKHLGPIIAEPTANDTITQSGRYQVKENVNIAIGLPPSTTNGFWRSPVHRNKVDHVAAYSTIGTVATLWRSGTAKICVALPASENFGLHSPSKFRSVYSNNFFPFCAIANTVRKDGEEWTPGNTDDQEEFSRLVLELVSQVVYGPASRAGTFFFSNTEGVTDDADEYTVVPMLKVGESSTNIITPGNNETTFSKLTWEMVERNDRDYRTEVESLQRAQGLAANGVGPGTHENVLLASTSSGDDISQALEDLTPITLVLATVQAILGIGLEYLIDSVRAKSWREKVFKAFIIVGEGAATLLPSCFLLAEYGLTTQTRVVGVDLIKVVGSNVIFDREEWLKVNVELGLGTEVQLQLLTIGLPTWFIVINTGAVIVWGAVLLVKAVTALIATTSANNICVDSPTTRTSSEKLSGACLGAAHSDIDI